MNSELRAAEPQEALAPPVETRGSILPRGYAAWTIIALMVVGLAVSLAGLALAFSVVRMPPSAAGRDALGQVAVLGIVAGGGAMCFGLGCLLFGWLGGSAYISVGSHRSILATTVLAFVVGTLLGVGFLRIVGFTEGDTRKALNAVGAAVYGVFVVMVYLQGVRTGLVNRETLGLTRGRLARGIAFGIAIGVAATALAEVYGWILGSFGIQMDQTQTNELAFLRGKSIALYTAADYLAVVMVAVAAPIVEELFFRAYVFNAYLKYKGTVTAYIASSLLFALIHGIPQFLPVFFIMACLLASSYRRSGTIVAPMVAHILNNGLFVVALAVTPQT